MPGHPKLGYEPNHVPAHQPYAAPGYTANAAPGYMATANNSMPSTSNVTLLKNFTSKNFEDMSESIVSQALRSNDKGSKFLVQALNTTGFRLAAVPNQQTDPDGNTFYIDLAKVIERLDGESKSSSPADGDAGNAGNAGDTGDAGEAGADGASSASSTSSDSSAVDAGTAGAVAPVFQRLINNGSNPSFESQIQTNYRILNDAMNGKGEGKELKKALCDKDVSKATLTVAYRQMQEHMEQSLRRILQNHLTPPLFSAVMHEQHNAWKALCSLRKLVYHNQAQAAEAAMGDIRNQNNLGGLSPTEMLIKAEKQANRYQREITNPSSGYDDDMVEALMKNAHVILNRKILSTFLATPGLQNATENFVVGNDTARTTSLIPELRTMIFKLEQTKPKTSPLALSMLADAAGTHAATASIAPGNFNRAPTNAATTSTAPPGLTNQIPPNFTPSISHDHAWSLVNNGRGPGKVRLRPNGTPESLKRRQMKDIEEKLKFQGVGYDIAAEIAGKHVIGETWLPAQELRQKRKRESDKQKTNAKKAKNAQRALRDEVGKLREMVAELKETVKKE
jgi:hypothetical protein